MYRFGQFIGNLAVVVSFALLAFVLFAIVLTFFSLVVSMGGGAV